MARLHGIGELNWELRAPDGATIIERGYTEEELTVTMYLAIVLDTPPEGAFRFEYAAYDQNGFVKGGFSDGDEETDPDEVDQEDELALPVSLRQLFSSLPRRLPCERVTYDYCPGHRGGRHPAVVDLEISEARIGRIRNSDRFLHAFARKLNRWARKTSGQ